MSVYFSYQRVRNEEWGILQITIFSLVAMVGGLPDLGLCTWLRPCQGCVHLSNHSMESMNLLDLQCKKICQEKKSMRFWKKVNKVTEWAEISQFWDQVRATFDWLPSRAQKIFLLLARQHHIFLHCYIYSKQNEEMTLFWEKEQNTAIFYNNFHYL